MFFKKKSDTDKFIKQLVVYISEKHKQLIIAPMHRNDAGIIYEQGKYFLSDYPIALDTFGTEIIANLNLFSIKDANLKNTKISDWAAFKHSKATTVKTFEKEYIRIDVSCVNASNLILTIQGVPYKECELTINSVISFHSDKEGLGKRIVKVYEACLTGKIK